MARKVKCPEGSTLDPMVEVAVLNEKKYTSAKDDITMSTILTWNEHLFYEPKNLVGFPSVYIFCEEDSG